MFRMPYQTSATNPAPQTIGTSAPTSAPTTQQRQPFGGMMPGFISMLSGLPPQVVAQLFGERFGMFEEEQPPDAMRRRRYPLRNFMTFYGGRLPQDAPRNHFARLFGPNA